MKAIINVLRDTQDELREIADELAHHGRETSERQVYESIGRIEAVKTIIESEHNDGSARRVLAGIVKTVQSGRFDGRPSHAEYVAAMEVLGI